MSQAGIMLDDNTLEAVSEEIDVGGEAASQDEDKSAEGDLISKSTEELKQLLDKAISEEAYEKASLIRDEINNRKKS